MVSGEIMLVILIVIGLIGRSPIIATAASILLVLKLTALERLFPVVERRGLELGLLFLTISVLVPFASEKISWRDITPLFTTVIGMMALAGGAIATWMNGKGLDLLRTEPSIIVGLVIGSIIGIVFLRGIPVGPLMAAGITAFVLKLWEWFGGR
ncbi:MULTISPECIES: DUF441 domain-containing protein [Brevibacillus]|jgi:uncharacterized membrane protein (DUF441 family)|uniref:UPF0756 membrane protein I532_07045 n=2 Tax=Brevibacillus TaxID=55080 RepID=M8E3A2_9BACL|nr:MULTISPECIES: DUF441 domain-containing protein [Brevibacillus]EMT53751.1 hypothetical protein I532_07045 [Brevibacillus borstelensis AK1]KKX56839.1 membrane protein [Brevibacillus borstelensis cifa_chp40]MBE5394664.1 DUF441 domain-containing protein [Brevibacillus borstelensis]MCC0562578.1 DUF441 domain-containing protein [Brevibacillus borstelensis]MCM3469814.1 DUF441 domain-containing protein [Brevibacillus borstelensis]